MLHQATLRAERRAVINTDTRSAAHRFAFLLLDGFNHLALASALEPLRIANANMAAPAFSWRLLSETGAAVVSSTGMTTLVNAALGQSVRNEMLIIVGGPATSSSGNAPLIRTLRREAAHGTPIGAFCGGIEVLAATGLLEAEDCAVHWRRLDGFAEEFPDTRPMRTAFTSGRFPTAPGGTVAGDLMIHLIARTQGADLAARIADEMLCGHVRNPNSQQTVSEQSRYGVRNPRLVKVLKAMAANLEVPLTAQEIADHAAMSMRQTERLFAKYLNTTPMSFYSRMRLDKARRLLMQTELSVTEIAIACGFQSMSHFAKIYRTTFGVTPRRMRAVSG